MTGVRDALLRRATGIRAQTLDLGGRPVPVTVRRSAKARRLILRVAFDTGEVVVTIPAGTPFEHGLVMAQSRSDWILERLDRLPPQVAFDDGATVPVLDVPHGIVHDPVRPRGVRQRDGMLLVGGPAGKVAETVHRWLRAEVRHQVTRRAVLKAERLGVTVAGIAVRDTRTRWGSCSARGGLSFSWRLILAPEFVLDYVVAHEVAHLRVRGHGREFWRTAQNLTERLDAARAWLSRNGHTLHRYG